MPYPALNNPFGEAATKAFAFLRTHGFRLVAASDELVQWESPRAFVDVSWSRLDGELFIAVGRLPRIRGRDFALSEILAFAGKSEAEQRPPQVMETTELEPFLQRLAVALREQGARAIDGDAGYFEELEEHRTSKNAESGRKEIRLRASEAWRRRDYSAVVRLYGLLGSDVSKLESSRLDYARRHRRWWSRLFSPVPNEQPD